MHAYMCVPRPETLSPKSRQFRSIILMLKIMEATTKTSLEEMHADIRASLHSSSFSRPSGGSGGGGECAKPLVGSSGESAKLLYNASSGEGGGRGVGVGVGEEASGERGNGVGVGGGAQERMVVDMLQQSCYMLQQLSKRLDEQSEEGHRFVFCVRECVCVDM